MKKFLFYTFIFLFGLLQAQTKSKSNPKTKKIVEKEWVNPIKLTKEERNRPYMEDVLKTRDSLTPKEAERRRKNIAIGNPFAKQGFFPKIATLSRGKYLEFHDRDSIVIIGSIKYNTKQKKIVELLEIDLSDPDAQPIGDTHGRWISPDPLSEEYSNWTPYNYVMNNPIINIDPDGMQVLTDFKLLKDGQVQRIDPNDGSEKRRDDRLFATNDKGQVDKSNGVTVDKNKPSDGSIISSLATNYGLKGEGNYPAGINFGRTSNSSDAANVFSFAAKNSNVEWGLNAFNVGGGTSYTVFTGHDNGHTPSDFMYQSFSKFLFGIHSHKGNDFPTSPVSTRPDNEWGDYDVLSEVSSHFKGNYPKHYLLYAPNEGASHLWQYNYINGKPKQFYPGKSSNSNPLVIKKSFNLKALK